MLGPWCGRSVGSFITLCRIKRNCFLCAVNWLMYLLPPIPFQLFRLVANQHREQQLYLAIKLNCLSDWWGAAEFNGWQHFFFVLSLRILFAGQLCGRANDTLLNSWLLGTFPADCDWDCLQITTKKEKLN